MVHNFLRSSKSNAYYYLTLCDSTPLNMNPDPEKKQQASTPLKMNPDSEKKQPTLEDTYNSLKRELTDTWRTRLIVTISDWIQGTSKKIDEFQVALDTTSGRKNPSISKKADETINQGYHRIIELSAMVEYLSVSNGEAARKRIEKSTPDQHDTSAVEELQ
ncbi:hypothetical protein Q1695_012359 [Nippostrongylus brasiliensis]|nr:hypothetical protein Q1695_012359 [Nippostrongylus brasiliensis]